jgi:cell division protein FtsL
MSTDKNRLRHTLTEQPWRNQTQIAANLALVVIVGIIIGSLYLIQTSTATTTGRELEQMKERSDDLRRDNERLRAEIAELQSLPRMMTRAAELGFRQAGSNEIQWIVVDGYRYDRPLLTPTPSPTPEHTDPGYDDTMGGWFQRQWESLKQQFDDWRNGRT